MDPAPAPRRALVGDSDRATGAARGHGVVIPQQCASRRDDASYVSAIQSTIDERDRFHGAVLSRRSARARGLDRRHRAIAAGDGASQRLAIRDASLEHDRRRSLEASVPRMVDRELDTARDPSREVRIAAS